MGHTASGPVGAALKRPRLEARAVVRIQSRNYGFKLSGRGWSYEQRIAARTPGKKHNV
jgi:hypothetical protein